MRNQEIPNRNHWIMIGKEILSSFYQLLILILFIPRRNIYYIIGLFIMLLIFSVYKWRKNVFYIKEGMLVSKSGVFSKQEKEIPLDRITTIDIEQGVMGRLFSLCTLKIDNGASGAGKEEVKMVIKLGAAERFKSELLGASKGRIIEQQGKEDEKKSRKHIAVSSKDLFLYSLTKHKMGWVLGSCFVIWGKLDDFLPKTIENKIENIMVKAAEDIQNKMMGRPSVLLILFYGLLLIAMLYLAISIIAVCFDYLRYYGFKISREDHKINIEYGMFTKKKYTLAMEKIQALRFKQNFIQRLTSLYNIEAVIMGYGDDEKKAILYPIAHKALRDKLISEILPEFIFEGRGYKPSNKHKFSFIIKRSLVTFLAGVPLVYWLNQFDFLWRALPFGIIILLQIFLGYWHYKNTFLGIGSNTFLMSFGAATKTTYIIQTRSIQSFACKQTILQKLHKISNYQIAICSHSFGEIITVKHLDEKLIEEIEGTLALK